MIFTKPSIYARAQIGVKRALVNTKSTLNKNVGVIAPVSSVTVLGSATISDINTTIRHKEAILAASTNAGISLTIGSNEEVLHEINRDHEVASLLKASWS